MVTYFVLIFLSCFIFIYVVFYCDFLLHNVTHPTQEPTRGNLGKSAKGPPGDKSYDQIINITYIKTSEIMLMMCVRSFIVYSYLVSSYLF